jgi:hypothetical protein
MAAEFRVFLSAVTSEFGLARDAVANDLQARDLRLRVQRSFRQERGADTLLRLLHDYIHECDAVICIIGARSGACPSPGEAAEFAHLLPSGMIRASYTQWEFFFAHHYGRHLWIYIAAADYLPDQDAPSGDDFPELQAAFNAHIMAAGLHYTSFSNRDQLRAEVLKEPWPEERRAKPILLPCQPRTSVQGPRGVSAPVAREPDARGWHHHGDRQQGALRDGRHRQDAGGGRICLGPSRRLHGAVVRTG